MVVRLDYYDDIESVAFINGCYAHLFVVAKVAYGDDNERIAFDCGKFIFEFVCDG